ncbi:MAG: hypothetical protein HY731_06055 [Candidatus Tectomicrobia bacterium]|nr:hypothetical protein [Candidatus Tectomicrobia bacterium]
MFALLHSRQLSMKWIMLFMLFVLGTSGCGRDDSDQLTNMPPILTPLESCTILEGQTLILTVEASDPNGDPITFSSSQLPPNASFDPTTGVFSFTPDFTQVETVTITFTASDGQATASEMVTIIIEASVALATTDVVSNSRGCPKLEDLLFQVTQSSDPERTANQRGLFFSQGRIRVIIELTSPAVSLPTGYSLVIETRFQSLVQALVAVQDLCRLSEEPSVRLVRAPFEAILAR